MDATGEPRYMLVGGMTFWNLTEAELDLFDIDTIPLSNHRVGRELANLLRDDSMNHDFMRHVVTSENLVVAMAFARRISKTDDIIVFDGSFGAITLSPSLAEHLIAKAPEISKRIEEQLMTKWLRQRGIDPEELSRENNEESC